MSATARILRNITASSSRTLLRRSPSIALVRHCRHFAEDAAATTVPAEEDVQSVPETKEGWLWVDSVFPISLGRLDLRRYVGYAREDTLLERLRALLVKVNTHGLEIVSLESHIKDGGVFVKFRYSAADPESAQQAILDDLRKYVHSHGGVPSWFGLPQGELWLVRGTPWREDMNRFVSSIVRVSFEGPDLSDEALYRLLRPYGRILDITPPSPVPAGSMRSAQISFRHLRSATSARNTIHSLNIPTSSASTVLRTSYAQPIAAHAVRDYIASHPRIFLPVLFFLLGTVTYAIFDPIRVFMVEGKVNDWFDYRQYKVYQWLRANTLDYLSSPSAESEAQLGLAAQGGWKERREAEEALEKYLADFPTTLAFMHGPQGSGKTQLLSRLLKDSGRKAIVIDIAQLSKASSDTALVAGLANQTGYWPVFSFLNSVNNVIDMASVGIIGQKAGLSSSLTDQLKDILDVVARGLSRGNASQHARREKAVKQAERDAEKLKEEEVIRERIKKGLWHDGRIDAVCGNGVMSELGVGVEPFKDFEADPLPTVALESQAEGERRNIREKDEASNAGRDFTQKQKRSEDTQTVDTLPVVIIKNFESKGGGARKEELLNVLASWAASLAENQIAHVVVVSDNRENVKRLAKALPSKPLNQISLSDADNASALSFVKQKLHDSGVDVQFNRDQISYIERLGGRASDLESLVHKVRSGMSVEEAVDDIVIRGVSELRKNAFGDDVEDAKNLAWTREQAWILVKQLAKQPEVSYHEVLMDFPFKGDETPLRSMEHAELITIGTVNGRPSTIKPGKPVFRWVFEQLVKDPTFHATQDIAFNQKIIASSEATVQACEAELLTLKDIDAGTASWWGSKRAVEMRENYLLKKMRAAEEKVESLERQNAQLKKVLVKARQ
ncbi:exonuclease [Dichomitus squalens LYAD-421 SS1]|uniref:exonuclease n=1 Tax=Dichomitus squalens (strain LYAD-421) TaxID=732165 RepID=UPI00044137D0|nr:exonuclease [Dichomitus squalens LYAD-421 SS1]EJF62443.1 exonuclease [Dichomitus squalens LYAD-421 SS1]